MFLKDRSGQSFSGFCYLEDRRSVKGGGHRKGCWSWTALVEDGAGCDWFADDSGSSSLRTAAKRGTKTLPITVQVHYKKQMTKIVLHILF